MRFKIYSALWVIFLSGSAIVLTLTDPGSSWQERWKALQSADFQEQPITLTSVHRLISWDANHYFELAESGYRQGHPNCAFYPLWPWCISISGGRIGDSDSIVRVVILANLFWIISCIFVSSAYGRHADMNETDAALLLFLCWPSSFVFHVPFSEALCLLLIATVFCLADWKGGWVALSASFLLPLCRPIGILIAPAVFCHYYRRSSRKAMLSVLFPIAGFASYLTYMKLSTGNYFEGFDAQRHYVNAPSLKNVLNVREIVEAFLNGKLSFGADENVWDRIAFLGVISTLPALWRLDRGWFFWVLGAGVIPALSSYFLSYSRFVVLLFPVFFVWARWLRQERTGILFRLVVLVLSAMQVVFFWRFLDSNRAT